MMIQSLIETPGRRRAGRRPPGPSRSASWSRPAASPARASDRLQATGPSTSSRHAVTHRRRRRIDDATFFPVEELARDERFNKITMRDRMADPRSAHDRQARAGAAAASNRLVPSRPDASRRRPGADARHLRRRDPGARGRRAHLLTTSTPATEATRSRSSSTWPGRLGRGPPRGDQRQAGATGWAPRSASSPRTPCCSRRPAANDPVLRLAGVNRALEGLAIDVFTHDEGVRRRSPATRTSSSARTGCSPTR